MTTLRPYQQDMAADATLAFASGARAVLCVLPTGGGKTVIFTEMAKAADSTAAIMAHRRELIRQAAAKLGQVPHGLIMPGRPLVRFHRIQVGSIQTMGRQVASLPKFGLIIVDEAHHVVSASWQKFLESQPDALILGFTATPHRLDGRGLGRESGGPFDAMVLGPSTAELIAGGYLVPSRVFRPPTLADLSGIRMVAGDFAAGAVAEAMDKPSITGDAVDHYRRLAPGLPAIAFCASVSHAEHVAEQFRADGWRSDCVHGALDETTRDARISGLATGSVQVLTACDLISEGLDVPAVGAVILLRPTQSEGMYLQMVGRGMRPAPGKQHLIILDHVGNTLDTRHGMPDAPRDWSLAGRTKRGKTASRVVTCPECFAAHDPAPACPLCGFAYETTAAERAAVMPETREGELIEVGPVAPVIPLKEAVAAAESWDDLEAIRVARGFKPGWTNNAGRYLLGRKPRRWTTAAEDFGTGEGAAP